MRCPGNPGPQLPAEAFPKGNQEPGEELAAQSSPPSLRAGGLVLGSSLHCSPFSSHEAAWPAHAAAVPDTRTRDLTPVNVHARAASQRCTSLLPTPTSGTHGPQPQGSKWSGAPRGRGSPTLRGFRSPKCRGDMSSVASSGAERHPSRARSALSWAGRGLAFTSAWTIGSWHTQAVAAHALTREEVTPPAPPSPRRIPATWPNPAPGNWVGREATGGRRLQGDYAPVSCNLSKWTGQAGPLRAGVKEASAPTPARPRTAGEPGRALNGAGWRQGSGRRGSGLETGDGKQLCVSAHSQTLTTR